MAKLPSDSTLSWSIDSGSGDSNVHRTLDKPSLFGLYADGSSLIGFDPTTSFADGFWPPTGSPAYYRVFGRSSCSGASIAP